MARRNPDSKPKRKTRSRDDRSATGAQPDFRSGGLVHPIQAHKFLEDGNSWVRADATVVGDSTFRVVFEDGTEKRFRCAHAQTARGVIEAHATEAGYPVFVSARWGVLALPVGEGGGPPPRRASFYPCLGELQDGGVVATPLLDGGRLLLFSIAETDAMQR